MNLLFILIALLLVSSILTVMKWPNSQNMVVGSIVGIITVILDLPILVTIISIVVAATISYFLFRNIIHEDFFENLFTEDNIQTVALTVFAVLVIILVFVSIFSDGATIKMLKQSPIFSISFVVMIISSCAGIPMFVSAIKALDLDATKDGDKIYVADNFRSSDEKSVRIYKGRTLWVAEMEPLIGREFRVLRDYVNNYIVIDDIKYYVKERRGKELQSGDVVKISKRNLRKGIIKRGVIILVEK